MKRLTFFGEWTETDRENAPDGRKHGNTTANRIGPIPPEPRPPAREEVHEAMMTDKRSKWNHDPAAISALPVSVIEPAFRTLLVAAVGAASLTEPGLGAAFDAAVALATVATRAQEEDRAAFPAHAKP